MQGISIIAGHAISGVLIAIASPPERSDIDSWKAVKIASVLQESRDANGNILSAKVSLMDGCLGQYLGDGPRQPEISSVLITNNASGADISSDAVIAPCV